MSFWNYYISFFTAHNYFHLPLPLSPLFPPSHHQPISVSPQQMHNIRQHPSTGPPPLLLAPRASVPSVQMQGQRIIQQGLIRVANVANTNLLVNIPQVGIGCKEVCFFILYQSCTGSIFIIDVEECSLSSRSPNIDRFGIVSSWTLAANPF